MTVTMKTSIKKRKGQAMLLTILALGGAILGATTIGGLLILNQIRATTDAAHSAQAVAAADAGIGWAEFDYYCNFSSPPKCVQPGEQPKPVFSPSADASVTVTCYDNSNNVVLCSETSTAVSAIAKGKSLNSIRAFFLDLTSASSTLP
jgi:hypothetical protein